MTEDTAGDSIDFDTLADAVDLALHHGEQEWLNSMSNTPGRGIRRAFHFCGRKILNSDMHYSAANTGVISVKSDLSAWPDEFSIDIIPPQFIKNSFLENYRSFSVKIVDSMTLNEESVIYAEVSVQAYGAAFYSWSDGNLGDRFAFSMNLARLAVAEFCEQQEFSGATAGEVIDYRDMNPERNEVRVKVVAGPFEVMKQISDVLNGSGVDRVCRFVTNKNLMLKGLDHDISKEQLKSVLESRYRMMEWCSQAESFLPVSVFAHHKECLCKHCEYEHYTKISKRL
jgi:hypothetical protein